VRAAIAGVVLVASAALALRACGGTSDDDSVRHVVTGYLAAVADGDGKRACALMTSGEAQRVASTFLAHAEGTGAAACPQAMKALAKAAPRSARDGLRHVRITAVKISGDHATVTIAGATRAAQLQRSGDTWLISGRAG
jgi:hypothetical protein